MLTEKLLNYLTISLLSRNLLRKKNYRFQISTNLEILSKIISLNLFLNNSSKTIQKP